MVSLLEVAQPFQEQHPNSVLKVSNDSMKIGLAKLSKKMSNVCGMRMSYEQNLNKSTLRSLLVLNPECQIKILEENLKFLFQEDSTYNYFQIKSNHLSFSTGSRDSVINSSNNAAETKTVLINRPDPTFLHEGRKSENFSERNKLGGLEETCKSLSNRKELFGVQTSGLSSNLMKSTKRTKNKRILSSTAQRSPIKPFFDQKGSEEYDNNRKDTDSQYEFTLEQEKIVSFVCSTSPTRKQTDKSSSSTEISDDQTVLSDHDSDSHSKLWTNSNGESDSLSDSAKNILCENNKSNTVFLDTDYLSKCQQISGSGKLLWHPPPSLSYDSLETPKVKQQLTFPAVLTNLNSNEPVSDNRTSPDLVYKNMESSFSRETTLFRETSLRGCYNMENIATAMILPQAYLQQELKKVKESIFSAVRLQKSPDDLVSDSILSILDICKSWLKLSSHLKGKEFIGILESNGANVSILNDFLQWQCVSRVFIDKMIDTLQKITPTINGSNTSGALNNLSSMTRNDVTKSVYSPGLPDMNITIGRSTHVFESGLPTFNCDINPNKNWKQRRFSMDQPKQLVTESNKTCKINCPIGNTYINSSQTHSPCNSEVLYGQGDPPLNCHSESQFCKIDQTFPIKNCYSGQGDLNCTPNGYGVLYDNATNSLKPEKNPNLPCYSKSYKHFFRERGGTKSYQTSTANNIKKDSTTLILPINPHNQAVPPNFTTVPPFYNSLMCYSSSGNYQINPNQFAVKQNPIQCTDSDVVEKCTKSSYMKPGSYSIPEKPIGFQKIINNNIPIEDSPVVGVPFLFSGTQGSVLSPKSISPISTIENQLATIGDDGEKKSEEEWKAAMTSAETFRDSLMASKTDSGPNLKLSDTVCLKTHFLLSDDFSQGSSSNDFKLSSESEELSSCERTSPVDVAIVESQVKTSDWLMQSFNRAVLENEREVSNHVSSPKIGCNNVAECKIKDIYISEKLQNTKKDWSSNSLSKPQTNFHYGTNGTILGSKNGFNMMDGLDEKPENCDAHLVGKTPNRNQKLQEDLNFSKLFDHKSSLFRKKAKSIFKRAITKPISSKLEDILNSICSTEVSSLVEFDCKSEKEVSKLEIKVRCPLYLQAMRCKLANHSYDTLDQALSDFQKYFLDIRNRNKGDKQSTDVVGALEHLFLDLVEKHFGPCQLTHQYFGLRDLSSTGKPRKSKKTPRRC